MIKEFIKRYIKKCFLFKEYTKMENKEEDPPMCVNCGEYEVEVGGQPCSQRCRDEYIADWLTDK